MFITWRTAAGLFATPRWNPFFQHYLSDAFAWHLLLRRCPCQRARPGRERENHVDYFHCRITVAAIRAQTRFTWNLNCEFASKRHCNCSSAVRHPHRLHLCEWWLLPGTAASGCKLALAEVWYCACGRNLASRCQQTLMRHQGEMCSDWHLPCHRCCPCDCAEMANMTSFDLTCRFQFLCFLIKVFQWTVPFISVCVTYWKQWHDNLLAQQKWGMNFVCIHRFDILTPPWLVYR